MGIMWKQAMVLIVGCIMIGWLLRLESNFFAILMMIWTVVLLEWNRRDDIKNGKCDP